MGATISARFALVYVSGSRWRPSHQGSMKVSSLPSARIKFQRDLGFQEHTRAAIPEWFGLLQVSVSYPIY